MAKIISFSTVFPAYHPRHGEPTNFIEKIDAGLLTDSQSIWSPKFHTIRAPKKPWQPFELFSPRYWKGAPYKSPHYEFHDLLTIKQVWKFEIKNDMVFLNNKYHCTTGGSTFEQLAQNNGLTGIDLKAWFKHPAPVLNHQIICWSDKITY